MNPEVEAVDTIAHRDGSWLTRPRAVGTSTHWAVQGGLFGGILAWLAPVSILADASTTLAFLQALFSPVFLAGALVGAGIGGVLGLAQPALLDRVRGRVPLPLVAVGQGALGAAAGAAVGTSEMLFAIGASTLFEVPAWPFVAMAASVGAGVGAVAALIGWLPVTMATVLGARTWPVTVTVATGIPAALLLMLLLT